MNIIKIAIITDIHGNAPALNAVLSDIDKFSDIEHIYCLGDMIGIGPDSNEVLHILFSRSDITMITGNHDEAILSLANKKEYPKSHLHVKVHHQWLLDRIDYNFISLLNQLPRMIHKEFEGNSVLFTHYQFKNDKINKPISEDPFSSIVDANVEKIDNLFKNNYEDLICFGHHHPIHYFKGDRSIYLNPGSLGCNHESIAPYAIVNFRQREIEIDIKEIKYDNQYFLKSFEKLKVAERKFILKAFYGQ